MEALKNSNVKMKLLKFLKVFMFTLGGIFLFVLVFAFTTGPFWMVYWLGTSVSECHFKPENIIIMGGSGMPSESALMRIYFAADLAKKYPTSNVYVSQPSAEGIKMVDTDAYRMKQELQMKGIDSSRIFLEVEGKNTREEAMNVLKINPLIKTQNCVIVTSPEHMRRSILTFRKIGFQSLGGLPTFNISSPVDLLYKDKTLGGRDIPLPEVGESIQLRYQFWNHLQYQVISYREFVALFWYRIRGWN